MVRHQSGNFSLSSGRLQLTAAMGRSSPAAARRLAALCLSAAALLCPLSGVLGQQWPTFAPKYAATTWQLSSNTNAGALAAIVDGNDTTAWQSDANFPTGFVGRADMNILLGLCASTPSACTGPAGSSNLAGATDTSISSHASVAAPSAGGPAALRIALPGAPVAVRRVTLRGILPANQTATVSLELAAGGTVLLGSYFANQSYAWMGFPGSPAWQGVAAIVVSCPVKFTLTEVGATSGPSMEQAVVDLGAVQTVGVVRTKYWPGGGGISSSLLASTDGSTFTMLAALDPAQVTAVTLYLQQPVQARYLAIRHTLKEDDWVKAYVWDIAAWGPPPPPPPPPPSPPPPRPPPPAPKTYAPGEWNPYAGSITSMAHGRPVYVSTAQDGPLWRITDSDENTMWQSDACFPTGYNQRDDMNPLKRACAIAGRCSASTGSTLLQNATDLDVYTGALVSLPAGTPSGTAGAFLRASLPAASTVYRVTLKAFGSANIEFLLLKGDGTSVKAMTTTTADNYNWINADGEWAGITAVRVQSRAGFTLTELAVQTAPCTQWAVTDLGSVKQVGMLRVRFWSPDADTSILMTSTDNVTWTTWQTFPAGTLPTVEYWLDQLTPVRFIKVLHLVTDKKPWGKVYMWELQAYDQYGRWGPPPAPAPHWRTFRDLLGVNAIWGWGMRNASAGVLYNAVASSARNYHGMNWDVRKPQNDPKYETMAKTGTDAMWWLDWGYQYRTWQAAGYRIVASFQFLAEDFPPSAWMPDPYAAAYQLGYKFASFFGPTRNNGSAIVSAVEFGNEPWGGFNATFYSTILAGYIAGAKAGDPALLRLPCALQASNPLGEDSNNGNFVGARVSQAIAPDLGALNTHSYSMYTGLDGVRRQVHPEHRGSEFNGLNNFMRWRDANTPGKPVWLTEWSWDGHRPGEPCMSTECVSQHAQAVYAVRGLMIIARKGIDQTHWFFYADGDNCTTTLFCRSGLRGANETGFPPKPVYRSLSGFMALAGGASFQAVISEGDDVWAYVLGDKDTRRPTHVIAWRPVEVGEDTSRDLTATVQLQLGAGNVAGAQPAQAWVIDGEGDAGFTEVSSLPALSGDGQTWTMTVGPAATLVRLQGT
ncbi:hypothetical protein ABPG75_013507 [Micractinium tetrahymenae]